jgi:hypothetical protein
LKLAGGKMQDDPRLDPPRVIAVSLTDLDKLTASPYALAIGLPGRHGAGQIDALFTKSGLFGDARTVRNFGAPGLSHNPFLVILTDHSPWSIRIEIIRNSQALLSLPDNTPVLAQWPGKYRSDWFHFTARDWREYVERAESKGQ